MSLRNPSLMLTHSEAILRQDVARVAPRPGLEPGTYGLTEIQAREKPI